VFSNISDLTVSDLSVSLAEFHNASATTINVIDLYVSTAANISTANISILNVSPTATIRTLNNTTFNSSTASISTINCSAFNISTLTVSHISTINASVTNLSVVNGNISTFSAIHISTINASVTNLSVVNGNISTFSAIHISTINASVTNLSVVNGNISTILFDNISGRDAYSTINTSVINATRIGAPQFDVVSSNSVSFYHGKILKVDDEFHIYGATNGQSSNIYFSTNASINSRNMFFNGNLNISTVANISTINCSICSISNLSALNSSLITCNISTLTVSNISGTHADFQNASITTLATYTTTADYLYLLNSNDLTQDPAIIYKVNSQLDINGGSLLEPAPIRFTTNNTSFNMVYDGNLNVSTTINCSTCSISNLSALNSSLITCNISTLSVSHISATNASVYSIVNTLFNGVALEARDVYIQDTSTAYAGRITKNVQLNIDGAYTVGQSANIYFSTNGVSRNMFYDGNLNVSTSGNISTLSVSTGTITTLGCTTINCSTTNISTHNACIANTLTGNVITLNSSTSNISTLNVSPTATIRTLGSTTINVSTINASTIASRQVGTGSINCFYGNATVAGSTNTSAVYQFNSIMYNNTSLITKVNVAQNAPAANTGFIIQTAGWYKIDVSVPVGNNTYTDRVTWQGEITVDGTALNDNAYAYSRHNDYGFRVQLTMTAVYYLDVNEYVWYKIMVAKATGTGFTDDFSGLSLYLGGQIVFTYLGAT
jgi:hypothetical protein